MTETFGLNLDGVESSYLDRGLGSMFYGLVRSHAPTRVVEVGTLYGYSGLHIAAALRDNTEVPSEFDLLDIWDAYAYRHSTVERTRETFQRNGLLELPHCRIAFRHADAVEGASLYPDESIDFLHLDVSNTGDTLRDHLAAWWPKIARREEAIVLVEGGSPARDAVPWMHAYQKASIAAFLRTEWVRTRFEYFTFRPFPSLTVLRRRDDSVA